MKSDLFGDATQLSTKMDETISTHLRAREAQALRFSIYGHALIAVGFSALGVRVAQSAQELGNTLTICAVALALLALIFAFVRQEKWLTASGIAIGTMDALVIAAMPFIWLEAAGGDAVPRGYLVKAISLPILTLAVMVASAIALRPLFVAVVTLEVCTAHALLLIYAVGDPRTVIGESWLETTLGPMVNIPHHISLIAQIGIIGVLLMLITGRARRLIISAIKMERLNTHIGRYFSPKVRDELSSAGADFFAPGGKEQEVVVLFSDIRGFTALSEAIGPQSVVALLSEYQKLMLQVIFKHGGTLDKFIGDAIFATFGTPTPAPDDADRAVACAAEMVSALDGWNEQRVARGETAIITGIGLHAGPAIVGNIGSEERLEYTVIGDTVNTASRVEGATKQLGRRVLVTGSVKERLTERDTLAMLFAVGPVQLRGKATATELYELKTPQANDAPRTQI